MAKTKEVFFSKHSSQDCTVCKSSIGELMRQWVNQRCEGELMLLKPRGPLAVTLPPPHATQNATLTFNGAKYMLDTQYGHPFQNSKGKTQKYKHSPISKSNLLVAVSSRGELRWGRGASVGEMLRAIIIILQEREETEWERQMTETLGLFPRHNTTWHTVTQLSFTRIGIQQERISLVREGTRLPSMHCSLQRQLSTYQLQQT